MVGENRLEEVHLDSYMLDLLMLLHYLCPLWKKILESGTLKKTLELDGPSNLPMLWLTWDLRCDRKFVGASLVDLDHFPNGLKRNRGRESSYYPRSLTQVYALALSSLLLAQFSDF